MRTVSQRQFSTETGIHILPLPYPPTIVVISPLFFFFFNLCLPCSCPASVLLFPSFCLLPGRPDVSPRLRITLSELHPQVLPHSTPAADMTRTWERARVKSGQRRSICLHRAHWWWDQVHSVLPGIRVGHWCPSYSSILCPPQPIGNKITSEQSAPHIVTLNGVRVVELPFIHLAS